MGGDTADAGADVDGGGSNSCVSVTGGGPEPWLDLQIVGRQFAAYEGRRIRIVVASRAGWRLGVADAAIANGAFALTIPATFVYGGYTEIALYVDDDTDDACDVGEPLWGWVTGIVQENLLVEATPDGPCLSGGGPSMVKGCLCGHLRLVPAPSTSRRTWRCVCRAPDDPTLRPLPPVWSAPIACSGRGTRRHCCWSAAW